MSGFWSGLTGKLAEKWLTLLVLPGALFLATATAAHTLGQTRYIDVRLLSTTLTDWAKNPATTTVGGQVVLLLGILAAAAVAGLAAQALTIPTERLALATGWREWPRPLASLAAWLTSKRRTAWSAAHETYHQYDRLLDTAQTPLPEVPTPPADSAAVSIEIILQQRDDAYRKRTLISLEEPDRPTWSGDRLNAVDLRLRRDFHLHLPTVWPYLWLTLPDADRTELNNARTHLTQAATLLAWAPIYLVLVFWWWPALILATGLALAGWRRLRTATDTYAQLLEATTRLHLTALANQLGIIDSSTMQPDHLGETVTNRLATHPPPPHRHENLSA